MEDELLTNISNVFGDDCDEFIQAESILFEILEIFPSDMLNFEIKNGGFRNVNVVVMFSEDSKNSNLF